MSINAILMDLAARATLIWRAFLGQFRELTPLWCAGVWLGATLAWALRPRRGGVYGGRVGAYDDTPLRRMRAPWGLMLGAGLGLLSPFSLLSLSGLLRRLARERDWRPLALGFGLASPLLSPSILAFTALALGPRMAWARVMAAWTTALLAGGALLLMRPRAVAEAEPPAEDAPPPASESPGRLRAREYLRILGVEFFFSGRHYLLALLVTAWLEVLLPVRELLRLLGQGRGLGVLVAAGLGGPLYICGGGAIAVVRELLSQGLGEGAALAYLTFGPASTVRALAGVAAAFGRRAVWALLVGAFVVAGLAGYLLDALAR